LPSAPGFVLDQNCHACLDANAFGQAPRYGIRFAARGERHDQVDAARRVGFRRRLPPIRRSGQCGNEPYRDCNAKPHGYSLESETPDVATLRFGANRSPDLF